MGSAVLAKGAGSCPAHSRGPSPWRSRRRPRDIDRAGSRLSRPWRSISSRIHLLRAADRRSDLVAAPPHVAGPPWLVPPVPRWPVEAPKRGRLWCRRSQSSRRGRSRPRRPPHWSCWPPAPPVAVCCSLRVAPPCVEPVTRLVALMLRQSRLRHGRIQRRPRRRSPVAIHRRGQWVPELAPVIDAADTAAPPAPPVLPAPPARPPLQPEAAAFVSPPLCEAPVAAALASAPLQPLLPGVESAGSLHRRTPASPRAADRGRLNARRPDLARPAGRNTVAAPPLASACVVEAPALPPWALAVEETSPAVLVLLDVAVASPPMPPIAPVPRGPSPMPPRPACPPTPPLAVAEAVLRVADATVTPAFAVAAPPAPPAPPSPPGPVYMPGTPGPFGAA